MSWVSRWKGKYVKINSKRPEALGVCDESGFVFNHKDLVKQMEWRGNSLVWTGFMVGRPYLDVPNQQNRPPLVKDDPKPVKNPRLPSPYTDPESPVVPGVPAIYAVLEENSFYSENEPPSYLIPNEFVPTPGWVDPSPVPSAPVLIAQLRKVSFQ